jgi:FkbM family methyltransferase
MGMVVMIQNPVIVMALYDIGRDNWNHFTMSYNTYLYWMKNTLSLDANIVIYTEEKFANQILEYRKEFDPILNKTILIIKPLEELDCYKLYYESLTNLMNAESFKQKISHNVPEMTKPLYNIIMFNKLNFLKHTKDSNYFNNDFLIWADAGGLREGIANYKNKTWPSLEKINTLDNTKITFFSHSADFSISDKEFHALSQIRHIQGTAFFVPSILIDEFVEEFGKMVEECVSLGFIGSDEKILDLIYDKNSNKYTLIKCSWRTYFDIFREDTDSLDTKKRIFIDLGTHHCQGLHHFIHHELDMTKPWEIHTFEPNPMINSDDCVKSLGKKNITLHKKAAWIKNERIKFKQYGADGSSQGSLIANTGGGGWYSDFFGEIAVEAIDILEFINTLDKTCDIYLKIDIEYAEYQVLKHMLDNGWPKNIKCVWVEWHGSNEQHFVEQKTILSQRIINESTKLIKFL